MTNVETKTKLCGTCNKRISKNYPPLNCATCKQSKHYKCELLSKNEAKALISANSLWTCKSCTKSRNTLSNAHADACTDVEVNKSDVRVDVAASHVTTHNFKLQCHACLGWAYSTRNVKACVWCEKFVHLKCNRGVLGCVTCCEEIIVGYHTNCFDLNENYQPKTDKVSYNPYHRECLINELGDRLGELDNSSDYWNELSELLLNCEYKQPSHVKSATSSELKILSLNVRSLFNKIDHFQEEIETYSKFDVLSFNETNCVLGKLPNGITDLILENFHEPILQDPVRQTGRGGGLALYINKKVCDQDQIEAFRPKFEGDTDLSGEFQFVKLHDCKGTKKTKLLINVYRSPSRSTEKFIDLLDNVLHSLERHSRKHIVFTGDFNVDLVKYQNDTVGQNLTAVFEKHGFVQLVSRPTRVTDHSATLIDHVYTNDVLKTLSCHVLTVNVSDHLATLTTLKLSNKSGARLGAIESERACLNYRKYNAATHATFESLIEGEQWSEVHNVTDTNGQYEKFAEIYMKHYEKAYPLIKSAPRRKNERRDPKPWILPWLEDACARRQQLFHKKIKEPSIVNIAAHKKIDKFCNKHIDMAKKKYYRKFFEEHSENSKKQWQVINGLLNRNAKYSGSIKLKDEYGNVTSDKSDVAARFNDYFSNIASNIKSQISTRQTFDPGGFHQFLQEDPAKGTEITLRPVSSQEVFETINKFKNKATLDTKIEPMKCASKDAKFTEILAEIINTSFSQGIFPSALKNARVVPIHKGGSKTDVTNYRPISLLCSFSKIYEKLMHARVLEFLDSNESLFESQYGFRPGMSCEHALLNAQNKILHSLNSKKIALLLLLDYSKAFDVIEHPIMLKKLRHYGIKGVALKWFESYLSGRRQFVTIEGIDSQPIPIKYGVPQGSILGPLLFIIYINDLPNISKLAEFILYADDANIIITGTCVEEIQSKLNNLTSLLIKWVDSNGLALNLKKTHYMIFSNQRTPALSDLEVSIAGVAIDRVKEARFLGVIIDEKLTWSNHIQAVKVKMNRYLGIMHKIKRHLPISARLQIYQSFVQSHVNFCSLVWGFTSKTHIDSLFTKQKQGVRIVMPGYVNYHYNDGQLPAHTRGSFKEYGVLTVHGVIVKNALLLMHKIKHFPQTVPKSIKNLFPSSIPTFYSNQETSSEWSSTYGSGKFRQSIFFKGPLLAITDLNAEVTCPPSLFSINIYKSNAKRVLIEHQSRNSDNEDSSSWPAFLLNNIPGLRKSQRIQHRT